jgi:two-component system cell cycle response regulator DivK
MLFFDDDQDMLSIVVYMLEEKGWQILTSNHCNNVVETVTDFQPSIIIMDNNIPDTGGVAATHCIKQQLALQHIPVVFCTGSADGKKLSEQAGADAYLAKPFNLVKLQEIITQLLPLQERNL